jgi:hypothetical protein
MAYFRFLRLTALLLPAITTADQMPLRPVYCVSPVVVAEDLPGAPLTQEIQVRASNNRGDTVFTAQWRDPAGQSRNGLFLGSGGRITTIAVSGTRVPGESILLFGELHAYDLRASINDSAEIAFAGRVLIQETIPPRESAGVFVFREGSIATVAIGDFFSGLSINNKGDIVFADAQGIHVWQPAARSTIVRVGQSVPGLSGAAFVRFGEVFSNSSGQVGFAADISGPRPGGGLFLYSGNQLSAVLLQGQVMGEYRFDGFGFSGIDEAGALVFTGYQVTGTAPPFKPPPGFRFGLFRYLDGSITPIVRLGQEVPGLDGRVDDIVAFSLTSWGATSASLRSASGNWSTFFILDGTFTPIGVLPHRKSACECRTTARTSVSRQRLSTANPIRIDSRSRQLLPA